MRGLGWNSEKVMRHTDFSEGCFLKQHQSRFVTPVLTIFFVFLFAQHELYIRAYHMLSDFPAVSIDLSVLIHAQHSLSRNFFSKEKVL